MTADQFRDAVGTESARVIAMGCGYSRAYWSNACTNTRPIPPERLACMLDKLEAANKQEAKFIREARKELTEQSARK